MCHVDTVNRLRNNAAAESRQRPLWMLNLLAFQELLRIIQVLVSTAAIITAAWLVYYVGENLAYTAAHHHDVKPHRAQVPFDDPNAKWGFVMKHFEIWYNNSNDHIYNIERASVMLATGVLCIVMSVAVIGLLIKRRLKPNLFVLVSDFILLLVTIMVYAYVTNVYQDERIFHGEMRYVYNHPDAGGKHWFSPPGKFDSISWLCAINYTLDDYERPRDLCNLGHRCYWLVLGICIGEACLLPIHAWFWYRERKTTPIELEPEDKAVVPYHD